MHRKYVNIFIILLVGLGMPAYYKIKFLILDIVEWDDILNWTLPVEIVFGCLLAASVVVGHDFIVSRLRVVIGGNAHHMRRLLIQFTVTGLYAMLAAVVFSIIFWDFIMGMPITTEYLFDYALLGLFIPILVNGATESMYFYGEWEKEVDKKYKLQKENMRVRYEALQNQVNPHFLFNCFNTLSVLINESKQVATQFLQQLSRVYRFILEIKNSEVIRLSEELDALQAYIYLMKYRFGENFNIIFDIDKSKKDFLIAPLTLQILMENALKHNLFDQQNPLDIRVGTRDDNALTFENVVRKKKHVESTKTGLQNLINRYKYLSDETVRIDESQSNFRVTVPLIEVKTL